MRAKTANTNPRYRNSSHNPAVHDRPANAAKSALVRGAIFSAIRNNSPSFISGIRIIRLRLAHWFTHSRPVKTSALRVVRHGSENVNPSSTEVKFLADDRQ